MWHDILKYTEEKVHAATLRRAYAEWRAEQGLPRRCDIPACQFHTAPLIWNGQPFTLILDHENGVNSDNRPTNLRYLCPNCNSQQTTHGGGNKGRVAKSSGGFGILDKARGVRHYTLPAESATYRWNAGDVELEYETVDVVPGEQAPASKKG